MDLLNLNLVKTFFGRYQGHAAQNASPESLGFGLLHYAFIRNMKPEHVLCIGSRYGFIPALCALACKDNGKGLVDFVDAGFDGNDPRSWAGVGLWKSAAFQSQKHFSLAGIEDYIETYVMTSREFHERSSCRYQYIHVDGDHSYEGASDDFRLWWPWLDAGGIMAFHDATRKCPGKVWGHWGVIGVSRLLDELREREGLVAIELDFGQGVALIQKPAVIGGGS